MADAVTTRRIGPEDDGRRLSLDEFREIDVVPGYRYELGRGVIQVAPIPDLTHGLILQEIDRQVHEYRRLHPNTITYYSGGDGAKLEITQLESERHPDRSIYTSALPATEQPWDLWTPTIAMEVVSPGEGARRRDYVQKREEYLERGVAEYWIIDPRDRKMLALTRVDAQWRERWLFPDGRWQSEVLPGFALELPPVFAILDRAQTP